MVQSEMDFAPLRTEETMQGYKLAVGVMARNEMQRYADPDGRCHQLTSDELDARVDVGWDLPA
jgi:hypothetical protein